MPEHPPTSRRLAQFGRARRGAMVLAVLCTFGAAVPALSATIGASFPEIDRFVQAQQQARHVPGFAYAVVDGTTVVHSRGFGSADRAGRAVTTRTPFVLGSTSKSFTARAVMQLVDAGAVRLVRGRAVGVSVRRRAARLTRGAIEFAVGALLLTAPGLTGQGYAGARLWMPDLALALLMVGGLVGATGLARIALNATAAQAVAVDSPAGATATFATATGGSSRSRCRLHFTRLHTLVRRDHRSARTGTRTKE